MPTSRHDRARDQILEDHLHRLHAVDGVLSWVADEQRRARALRDHAIREAAEAGLSLRQIGGALGLSAQGVRSTLPGTPAVYDQIGTTYAQTRQPDPHIQSAMWAALEGARTVVNVGAGTGSYEPPETLLAVEPSLVMVAQRPPGLAPAAITTADRIPLPDHSVDAALCSLTIHHWPDLEAGLAEVRRVARRAVIFTWDQTVARDFWLIRDYLPEYADADDARAISIDRLCDLLDTTDIRTVPVPRDCTDGFLGAFWARPEAYLDPIIRAGISGFAQLDAPTTERGLTHLLQDLRTRTWHRRHTALLKRTELDLGYRLIVANWSTD